MKINYHWWGTPIGKKPLEINVENNEELLMILARDVRTSYYKSQSIHYLDFKYMIFNGEERSVNCRESYLAGANFYKAQLNTVDFKGSMFGQQTFFKKAIIKNCDFSDCDLRGCIFTGAIISNSRFNISNYDRKRIIGIEAIDSQIEI